MEGVYSNPKEPMTDQTFPNIGLPGAYLSKNKVHAFNIWKRLYLLLPSVTNWAMEGMERWYKMLPLSLNERRSCVRKHSTGCFSVSNSIQTIKEQGINTAQNLCQAGFSSSHRLNLSEICLFTSSHFITTACSLSLCRMCWK